MNRRLTAIVEREGKGYVALCPEVDVASQGESVAEARDDLAEALALFFETAPADEVDRHLRGEVYVARSRLRLAGLRVLSGREVCRILAGHGVDEFRRRGGHIATQKQDSDGTVTERRRIIENCAPAHCSPSYANLACLARHSRTRRERSNPAYRQLSPSARKRCRRPGLAGPESRRPDH